MKVRVDRERCQGHTQCNFVAPEIFMLDDEEGRAYVTSETVPPGLEENALLAARSCPELAIEIE